MEVTWRKSFLGTSYVVCVELTCEVGVAELVQQLRGRVWEEGKTADMSEQAGGRCDRRWGSVVGKVVYTL